MRARLLPKHRLPFGNPRVAEPIAPRADIQNDAALFLPGGVDTARVLQAPFALSNLRDPRVRQTNRGSRVRRYLDLQRELPVL